MAFWNKFFSWHQTNQTGSYNAGSTIRRATVNWTPKQTSALKEVSQGERAILVSRAYDSYRNFPLARAIVNRIALNAIGCGLTPTPAIDAKVLGLSEDQIDELEEAIEREYSIWSSRCDLERTMDFGQMQRLILTSELLTGDGFANSIFVSDSRELYSLKLQVIDSDRVSNPSFSSDTQKIRRGVEINSLGQAEAYYVTKVHPSDIDIFPDGYQWLRVPAYGSQTFERRFFHLFDKMRPEQVRGISVLAPVLEPIAQLSKHSDSELMATVLQSYLTFFIESEGEELDRGFEGTKEDSITGKRVVEIGNGAVVQLEKGQKVEMANPTRPSTSFESFHNAVTRQICASTGVPFDEVLLKFENSYSALKGVMHKAWQLYKIKRENVVRAFCDPAYSLFFDEAVSKGRLPNIFGYEDPLRRLAYQKVVWIGAGKGSIDETKEVDAADHRIKLGLSSRSIETAQLMGISWKSVLKQIKREKIQMDNMGIKFEDVPSKKVEPAQENVIENPIDKEEE